MENKANLNEHEVTGNYGEIFVDPAYSREFIASHPDWSRKRFVVHDKTTGVFILGVYADRFEVDPEYKNSFNGSGLGNFFIGGDVVASVELNNVVVCDSGGRAWDRKRDIIARIKYEMRRLAELQEADREAPQALIEQLT